MRFTVDFLYCNKASFGGSYYPFCFFMGMERDLNFNLKTSNPRVMIDIRIEVTTLKKRRVVAWVLPDLPAFVKILALSQSGKNDAYSRSTASAFHVHYILFACSNSK
jgi:hypothetical protein